MIKKESELVKLRKELERKERVELENTDLKKELAELKKRMVEATQPSSIKRPAYEADLYSDESSMKKFKEFA